MSDNYQAVSKLVELGKKATSGPWSVFREGTEDDPTFAIENQEMILAQTVGGNDKNNALFFIAARNALPALEEMLEQNTWIPVAGRENQYPREKILVSVDMRDVVDGIPQAYIELGRPHKNATHYLVLDVFPAPPESSNAT